jgi:leader peptidase (prepilin peptidase) / N-methyltransferase
MANIWSIVIFLFGAVVGSFLNVCIYRIPESKSVVRPRSSCPKCGSPIRACDNIPILSWFILKGKCRDCREAISPRYVIVEALTGLLLVALYLHFGISLKLAATFIFGSALIVITFIDLDHQVIPDIITLPGIPICFLLAVLVLKLNWLDALLGMLIGGGALYLISIGYRLFTKREGMGMGDVKLLAMLGAFLGWKSLIFILFISSFTGSLIGITIILIKKGDLKYAIPFGPFLSFAAICYCFVGQKFTNLILGAG